MLFSSDERRTTLHERRARCAVPGGVERRALPPRRRFVYEFPLRELTPSAERRSVRGGIPNPARRDCGHRHAVCFASAPGDATRYDPCPFSRTVSLANRPSSVRSPSTVIARWCHHPPAILTPASEHLTPFLEVRYTHSGNPPILHKPHATRGRACRHGETSIL